MVRLIVLFLLADIALMVLALVDCLTTPGSQLRTLSKPVWVLLILLLSPVAVGPVLWFLVGRPRAPRAEGAPARVERRPHTVAPDDDPEFLRNLARSLTEERHRREAGGEDT